MKAPVRIEQPVPGTEHWPEPCAAAALSGERGVPPRILPCVALHRAGRGTARSQLQGSGLRQSLSPLLLGRLVFARGCLVGVPAHWISEAFQALQRLHEKCQRHSAGHACASWICRKGSHLRARRTISSAPSTGASQERACMNVWACNLGASVPQQSAMRRLCRHSWPRLHWQPSMRHKPEAQENEREVFVA